MMKSMTCTHAVTFLKKVPGQGWTYNDFKTTETSLRSHLTSLANLESKGVVRLVSFSRLK
jgi:hypothetical protein